MTNVNPIGPDFEGKKYITRIGDVVTFIKSKGGYLFSCETGSFYESSDKDNYGNFVFCGEEHPDDIISEYKEPD